ncbi:YtpR family tRNA-binding protein [Shouchella shacheensis]|uniref:YtpR family tRNA-binding protein n=1 Tax=Shouchella shacheensis TaxID=1649580 RepID=UPI00073FD90C|nr:DUF4479 domain-containing protein [Shouchella shacheensis]
MNAFYNLKGVGDTLLLTFEQIEREEQVVEQSGDVAIIRDKKDGETVGVNIFNASTYGEINRDGPCDVNAALKTLIVKAFSENQVELDVELSGNQHFVIGEVLSKEKHPNADKLSLCRVDVGDETLQIVCGAPNVEAKQKVVIARIGAVMPSGLVIKESVLRGVESNGMICSAKELGLKDASEEKSILVLEDDAEVGQSFKE